MKPYDKEAAYKRICSNKECKEIYEKLAKRGVTQNQIQKLKANLVAIPWEWQIISTENVDKRKERRRNLAIKMRELSSEIASDIDAQGIRIFDEGSIFTDGLVRMPSKPTVAQFLRDLADHIDNLAIGEKRLEFESFRPKKGSRKIPMEVHYAKRRIFEYLSQLLEVSRAPNKETAIFVNVLLDLAANEKVCADDITQMRKHIRRKYWVS